MSGLGRHDGAVVQPEADVVDVMVQLSPEATEAARAQQPAESSLREAQEQLQARGFALEPLHVEGDDSSLASWFRVSVEDVQTAEQIASLLRTSPAVESAYVEPASAPPD